MGLRKYYCTVSLETGVQLIPIVRIFAMSYTILTKMPQEVIKLYRQRFGKSELILTSTQLQLIANLALKHVRADDIIIEESKSNEDICDENLMREHYIFENDIFYKKYLVDSGISLDQYKNYYACIISFIFYMHFGMAMDASSDALFAQDYI
jgi:hypothetical protein